MSSSSSPPCNLSNTQPRRLSFARKPPLRLSLRFSPCCCSSSSSSFLLASTLLAFSLSFCVGSGVDLAEPQWREVLDLCRERSLTPVLDIAYQGYATGDLVRDSFSTRLFCNQGDLEFFVSQSFAKNMGLYGERIGMLHVVSSNPRLSLLPLPISLSGSMPLCVSLSLSVSICFSVCLSDYLSLPRCLAVCDFRLFFSLCSPG